MFHLYHSNDLDVLRGILVDRMAQQPPGPFEQEAILVQSQGMAHWLKLQLADGLGIAAQINFPLPSSFVWKVFNLLKPELPERSHFEKQSMAWKLMRLLPELIDQPQYQAIRHYLKDDQQQIKCYQLAHKIADVFDQYLVYRPDWLLNWESGDDAIQDGNIERHPWQAPLWRELVKDSDQLNHSLDHRARLAEQLEHLVTRYPERLNSLPKRISVFGIAALPGSYWQVLQAISTVIDVHFYLLNPCRNFWGDILDDKRRLQILKRQPDAESYLDRGNPLLASWGKLGREFLTLVHDTELQDIEAYVDIDRDSPCSLLRHLQADILNLEDKQKTAFLKEALESSAFKQQVSDDDQSIRFVTGHSPLREVQQLHDQLLSWFSDDKDLKPRDIVVMVPDIDQYAPFIDAVFSSVSDHTRIPWAIADQSMVQENPVIDAWLRLLGLADSRLLITEVQDWLDVAAIRQKFDISESDLELLKDWLKRAEIRWGLDSDHRQSLGLPAFSQNSWRTGLRQLLLGLMLPDGADAWQQDYPVIAVEGSEGEVLGKLMAFIDCLEQWQTILAEANSPDIWCDQLLQMIDAFYLPDVIETTSVQKIRDAIARWNEGLSDAGFNDTVSPQVVRAWFIEQLGQQGGWQRFLAGPVNFCTLMPMRSIPFKAVCLLGMNDEDYPRRTTPIGFDLMIAGGSRRGDRSRRDDDRYLFLEAVCSAQDKLYISYRGRDSRENSELQPSVLVSELQDYLADGYTLEQFAELPHKQSRECFLQHLTTALPLQPFNKDHFHGFQHVWAQVANVSHGANAVADPEADFVSSPLALPEDISRTEVLWSDVKHALSDPCKFFVRRRLGANLDIYWQHHQTEEPFVPDGLELFQLREQWLSEALEHSAQQSASADFLQKQQSLGKLPVNSLGQLWSDDISEQLLPLAQQLVVEQQQPVAARGLIIRLEQAENIQVIGELQEAFYTSDDSIAELIRYRLGGIRGKHLLDAWLDLVLASACGAGGSANSAGSSASDATVVRQARIYGLDKKTNRISQLVLKAPLQSEAINILERCISWYWQCWSQPVALLPDLIWECFKTEMLDKLDGDAELIAEAQQKLIQKQINSDFSSLHSPYVRRCLPELPADLLQPESFDHWYQQCRPLFEPVWRHIKTETEAGGES